MPDTYTRAHPELQYDERFLGDPIQQNLDFFTRSPGRDLGRIKPMLNLLEKLWSEYPDLRLLQLIKNLVPEDGFYLEDDKLAFVMEGSLLIRKSHKRPSSDPKAELPTSEGFT